MLKQKAILFFIILSGSFCASAQYIIQVEPNNLTAGDTMSVTLQTSLPFLVGSEAPYFCGELISITDTTSNNTITIDILLDLTGVKSPAGCSRFDTVEVILPTVAGSYELKAFLSTIDTISPMYTATRFIRDSTTITVGSPIGIEELNNKKALRLFPNPSSSELTIQGFTEGCFEIYNNVGMLVQGGTFSKSIDISNLSEGLYFLVLDNSHRLKFVVDQ